MPVSRSLVFALCIATAILSGACKKSKPATPAPGPVLSSDKAISAIMLAKATNGNSVQADLYASLSNDTFTLVVPAKIDLTALIPTITFTGKTVLPASGAAQNFSSPVTYTVTAEDGSSKKFVVRAKYRSTLFISTLIGYLYAMDAGTGDVIWNTQIGTYVNGSATVGNGLVYTCSDNGLYAIYAATGAIKWQIAGPLLYGNSLLEPTPLLNNGVLYIGFTDGNMYALDAQTGAVKWKTSNTVGFYSSPAISSNTIYMGGLDSCLYVLDAQTGVQKWKQRLVGVVLCNPLVLNNTIYTGCFGGSNLFYAIDGDGCPK